jgi:hypothetical protein
MEMPKIIVCDATECAYNQDQQCHALAITVGDGNAAKCDTFWNGSEKGGDPDAVAGVGACRAIGCRFNDHLECSAPGINVGHSGNEIDCLTFAAKS